MVGIILGGIGVAILVIIELSKNSGNKLVQYNREKFISLLKSKNLTPDQIIFSTNDNFQNCISVNEMSRKISFGYIENKEFQTTEYDFSDMVAFEVQVDDQKTGNLSVGRALVGGVLAGGVGAIIGGTTGKSKSKVKNIHLLLTVNCISNPLVKFPILTSYPSSKGYDSTEKVVQNAIQIAEKWTAIFNVILNK
jgi:hypothetical protein